MAAMVEPHCCARICGIAPPMITTAVVAPACTTRLERRTDHASEDRGRVHRRAPGTGGRSLHLWRAGEGCDDTPCFTERGTNVGQPIRYAARPRLARGHDVSIAHDGRAGRALVHHASDGSGSRAATHHDDPLGPGQLRDDGPY